MTTQSAAPTFLYTGSNPIQTGVVPSTIVAAHVSTLRGRVLNAAGAPLSGATSAVLNHPDFGGTKSRADGWYELVVNGGGKVTLAFTKAGYLGAQRVATAPRQDYGKVDDVVLLKRDTAVTAMQFGAVIPAQMARASVNTNADGTHRATMIIDAGAVVRDGTRYRFITDHLGSVRFVVDAITGSVQQRLDYDEYGRVTANTNPDFQPFGFAGGLLDDATGMVRFGARDYLPSVDRFATLDPIRLRGGTNTYAYTSHADPINQIDPTGLDAISACIAALLSPYFPGLNMDDVSLSFGWDRGR